MHTHTHTSCFMIQTGLPFTTPILSLTMYAATYIPQIPWQLDMVRLLAFSWWAMRTDFRFYMKRKYISIIFESLYILGFICYTNYQFLN